MNKKLFGTDGIRGKANVYPMTPEVAMAVGKAIAYYYQKGKATNRIVIGKDTRRSSYMIELATAAGVTSMGSNAVLLGPIPTPAVGYLTKAMRADAGIMISASHNSFEDNGIKFFGKDGYKLSDKIELEIEKLIEQGMDGIEHPTNENVGKAFRVDDALGRYIQFTKTTFPNTLTLQDLKVVVDCAHGAAYKLAPRALWELEADVVSIGVDPNGTNINKNCGSLYPETMCKTVRDSQADIGVALDGDADRVILCDEEGTIIDGDQIIALCVLSLKEQGLLKQNKVVGTIMSNMGVEQYLKKNGIDMIRTQVGDRYVIEEMRKGKINIGGEPSGHIIFSDYTTTGDGLIAALQVMAKMLISGKTLKELVADITLYPQVSQNIIVKDKTPINELPELEKAIKSVDKNLEGKGRAIIRYSGTEPKLRLMIEGENENLISDELDKLTEIAERNLT